MAKFWKNKIGEETILNSDAKLDEWNEVIQSRVAPYLKLYTEVKSFETFMILSHRNLLSLYDLGINNCWVDTI